MEGIDEDDGVDQEHMEACDAVDVAFPDGAMDHCANMFADFDDDAVQ